jgi:amphi-Trp domain-containing protein
MREIEKNISKKAFINKLKRLIANLESHEAFTIQIKKKKINVPAKTELRVEYEKDGLGGELEFELKWIN